MEFDNIMKQLNKNNVNFIKSTFDFVGVFNPIRERVIRENDFLLNKAKKILLDTKEKQNAKKLYPEMFLTLTGELNENMFLIKELRK